MEAPLKKEDFNLLAKYKIRHKKSPEKAPDKAVPPQGAPTEPEDTVPPAVASR